MPKCGVALTRNLVLHFTLHLVDLPGFGRSRGSGAMSLADMACSRARQAPDKAIWLGWNWVGLVASQVALTHPERVQALVTVASSPCFSAGATSGRDKTGRAGRFPENSVKIFSAR